MARKIAKVPLAAPTPSKERKQDPPQSRSDMARKMYTKNRHSQPGWNYYHPYPPQSRSNMARKIPKVPLAGAPTPSKERKEEVANKLLQGVADDGKEEHDELARELVRDEEDEEDIPEEHVLEYAYMIHEYEILQGHDMIRKKR